MVASTERKFCAALVRKSSQSFLYSPRRGSRFILGAHDRLRIAGNRLRHIDGGMPVLTGEQVLMTYWTWVWFMIAAAFGTFAFTLIAIATGEWRWLIGTAVSMGVVSPLFPKGK